jgi:hypothetical protein
LEKTRRHWKKMKGSVLFFVESWDRKRLEGNNLKHPHAVCRLVHSVVLMVISHTWQMHLGSVDVNLKGVWGLCTMLAMIL